MSHRKQTRAAVLALLVALSAVGSVAAFAGSAAAVSNETVTASDAGAGATGVTYTASASFGNSKDSDYVTIHLNNADVSQVDKSDVTIKHNGNTRSLSSLKRDYGGLHVTLSQTMTVNNGDSVTVEVDDVNNPGSASTDVDAQIDIKSTSPGDTWRTISGTVDIVDPSVGGSPPATAPSDEEDDSPEGEITSMQFVGDGSDLDLQVTANGDMSGDIYADVATDADGQVNRQIVGGEFDEEIVDYGNEYVYTADVAEGVTGEFTADVMLPTASDDRVVSTNASATGSVGTTMAADPADVGASDATHTFRVDVDENSSITNTEIEQVAFDYDIASANGSVTSVSDDQNVVTFKVVTENGTVRRELGDTDAITVNVEDGEVQLDPTSVDGNLELHSGETLVVGLNPVTNPDSAGTYDVDVTIRDADSDIDSNTASFTVE